MVTSESGYNETNYQPGDAWEIDHGYDVFAADGEKVGDVQEVHPYYLVVSKGFFFPTERYVPVAAIVDVREERVSLNVTKDQIDSQGWDTVPEAPVDTLATDDALVDERVTSTSQPDSRRGFVRVQRTVTEEQAAGSVSLREETVRVERQAVAGSAGDTLPADAFQETELDIPLRGEVDDVTRREHQ